MRLIRLTRLAALLAGLTLVFAASTALGDGDPASDYLLIQDTFFPFQEMVSPNVAAAVRTTVARAKAAGFPLKVAIISAATDLGSVPNYYGEPQQYASFLDQEISFNAKQMLLVVMPQGFGVSGTGPARVLAGQTVAPGTGADRLARAAIPAIGVLAAHAGHPITLPTVRAATGTTGGGTSPLLTFGAPVALVLLVAGGAAIAKSRAGPSEPWPDDDEDGDEDGEARPPRETIP